jgi:uncharacterized lipoprotein NlpE involved in copper resistance
MTPKRVLAVAATAGVMLILAGCSNGANHPAAAPTRTTGAPRTTSTAATATTTSTTTTTAVSPTTTSSPTAKNLAVTAAVRAQLLQAGAAFNSLPASDYTGLQPGTTYYAYDPTTNTYWAGAALAPSPSSTQAQVSSQDDGSYLLFTQSANGAWVAHDVGLAGVGGSQCPLAVPPAILALWNWAPGTCRAPGS